MLFCFLVLSSESLALLFQLLLFFCLLSFIGFRCSLSLLLIRPSSSPSPTVRHRQLLSAGVAFRLPETTPRRWCGLCRPLSSSVGLSSLTCLGCHSVGKRATCSRVVAFSFHFDFSSSTRILLLCFLALRVQPLGGRGRRCHLQLRPTPHRSASSGRSLRLIRVSFSRRTNETSRLSPATMTLR